ncbi:MAG: hypothetical protein HQL82_03230 [Magnetococcales bacterium]|nr:hypothetical protein [Magnetococcales bacterium]
MHAAPRFATQQPPDRPTTGSRPAIWLLLILLFLAPAAAAEDTPAVTTYRAFATAFTRGDLTQAAALAADQALEVVARKQALANNANPAPETSDIMIVGEQPNPEGSSVDIVAVQVVHTPTQGPLLTSIHQQQATVARRDGQWRVVRFMDNLEKCCLP